MKMYIVITKPFSEFDSLDDLIKNAQFFSDVEMAKDYWFAIGVGEIMMINVAPTSKAEEGE